MYARNFQYTQLYLRALNAKYILSGTSIHIQNFKLTFISFIWHEEKDFRGMLPSSSIKAAHSLLQ